MPDVPYHKPYRRKLRSPKQRNFNHAFLPLTSAPARPRRILAEPRQAAAFYQSNYRARDFEAALHSIKLEGNIKADEQFGGTPVPRAII
jgi:hypothetical protein